MSKRIVRSTACAYKTYNSRLFSIINKCNKLRFGGKSNFLWFGRGGDPVVPTSQTWLMTKRSRVLSLQPPRKRICRSQTRLVPAHSEEEWRIEKIFNSSFNFIIYNYSNKLQERFFSLSLVHNKTQRPGLRSCAHTL